MISRAKGASVIASAAYRAGEKLYSERYGETSDYTRKRGVVCSGILLPAHAPPEYADRQTLWNAVEKNERRRDAQLAYSDEFSFQNEFTFEENMELALRFLQENFVSKGLICDYAVHDPEREPGGTPNPHMHVLIPMRAIEPNGLFGKTGEGPVEERAAQQGQALFRIQGKGEVLGQQDQRPGAQKRQGGHEPGLGQVQGRSRSTCDGKARHPN